MSDERELGPAPHGHRRRIEHLSSDTDPLVIIHCECNWRNAIALPKSIAEQRYDAHLPQQFRPDHRPVRP